MNRLVGLAALLGLLSGCAWMSVCSVPNVEADKHTHGFRYYETAPYIIVYTDNQGGLKTLTKYLPDTTRLRSVRPHNILATHNMTLKFTNGTLSQATSEVDTTAVPVEIIKAFEKVATAAMMRVGEENQVAPPYIFKVTRLDGQFALVGGKGVGPDGNPMEIFATLGQPKAQADTKKTGDTK